MEKTVLTIHVVLCNNKGSSKSDVPTQKVFTDKHDRILFY